MTEQELARALIQAGRVTPQQVQEAAQQRGPGRGIAHVLVESGAVSAEEILQLDPHAFEQAPEQPSTPVAPPTPVPSPTAVSSPAPVSSPTAPAQMPSPAPAQIRFGAIGEAWRLCRQQSGLWMAAVLVTGIIQIGVSAAIGNLLQAIPGFEPPVSDPTRPWDLFGPSFFLQTGVSTLLQVPVSAFLMGGLLRMAINQLRTGTANVGDIFTVTDVFPALMGAYFVVVLAVYVGSIFCVIPGLLLGGLLMFAMPIVVNQRLGAGEALGLSWNTLKPHALSAALFIFVATLASFSGLLLCCIGVLFTMPILYLSLAIVYRDFFPDAVGQEAASVEPSPFPPPPIPQPPSR